MRYPTASSMSICALLLQLVSGPRFLGGTAALVNKLNCFDSIRCRSGLQGVEGASGERQCWK